MKKAYLIVIAAVVFASTGCAGTSKLRLEGFAGSSVEEGTYAAYLYSATQLESLEGNKVIKGFIAILDLEGDDYEFDLRAPEFQYGTVKGLTGPEAVSSAEWFIGREYTGELAYSRILVGDRTVGYEIRPEYEQVVYRMRVINADYFLAGGNKVRVVFRIEPQRSRSPAGGRGSY